MHAFSGIQIVEEVSTTKKVERILILETFCLNTCLVIFPCPVLGTCTRDLSATFIHLDFHLPLEFVGLFLSWVVSLMDLTITVYFFHLIYFPCWILSSSVFPPFRLIYLLKWRKTSTREVVVEHSPAMNKEWTFISQFGLQGLFQYSKHNSQVGGRYWGKIRFPEKPHFKLNLGPDVYINMKTHLHIHKQEIMCTFLLKPLSWGKIINANITPGYPPFSNWIWHEISISS